MQPGPCQQLQSDPIPQTPGPTNNHGDDFTPNPASSSWRAPGSSSLPQTLRALFTKFRRSKNTATKSVLSREQQLDPIVSITPSENNSVDVRTTGEEDRRPELLWPYELLWVGGQFDNDPNGLDGFRSERPNKAISDRSSTHNNTKLEPSQAIKNTGTRPSARPAYGTQALGTIASTYENIVATENSTQVNGNINYTVIENQTINNHCVNDHKTLSNFLINAGGILIPTVSFTVTEISTITVTATASSTTTIDACESRSKSRDPTANSTGGAKTAASTPTTTGNSQRYPYTTPQPRTHQKSSPTTSPPSTETSTSHYPVPGAIPRLSSQLQQYTHGPEPTPPPGSIKATPNRIRRVQSWIQLQLHESAFLRLDSARRLIRWELIQEELGVVVGNAAFRLGIESMVLMIPAAFWAAQQRFIPEESRVVGPAER